MGGGGISGILKGRLFLTCALIVALVGVVPGVMAADQPRWGGTLLVGLAGDPFTLNPDLPTFSTHADEMARSLFDPLVVTNRNWAVIPRLARAWEVSADAKTYTLHLDPRAMWHDGQPVTSADVKWTFETVINGKGWGADFLKGLDRVETPDTHTVRIILTQPNAGFLSGLAQNGLSILPEHAYQGTDWTANPHNLNPIGSGPFKFVRYEKGDHVELTANGAYFGGRPYLDHLIFRVVPDPAIAVRQIEAGELDLSTQYAPAGDVPRLRKSTTVKLLDYTYPVIQWLGFNVTRPPFSDVRVRRAVANAVDRIGLNLKCNGGVGIPSQHLYLEGHWATDSAVRLPAYNLNTARNILAEAGYGPKNPLRTSLLVYEGYGAPECAQVVQEQLAQAGIQVTLNALEWDTYIDKGFKQRDFAMIYGSGFEGPDPSMLQAFVGTGGFQNPMGYSNAEVDALLQKAQAVSGQPARAAFYGQIQKILLTDLPRLPLHDRKVVFPSNPNFQDFWQETTAGAVQQGERSYERTWWTKGNAKP